MNYVTTLYVRGLQFKALSGNWNCMHKKSGALDYGRVWLFFAFYFYV